MKPLKQPWVSPLLSLPGAPHREVYFMGLIDVLTQYDTKKKAAHAAKTVKHGVSSTGEEGKGWGGDSVCCFKHLLVPASV